MGFVFWGLLFIVFVLWASRKLNREIARLRQHTEEKKLSRVYLDQARVEVYDSANPPTVGRYFRATQINQRADGMTTIELIDEESYNKQRRRWN